ncbi:MAG: biotin/lipoyl-binding protein [Anaerolineales bacterium]|nr:biotin/lipoyl-binding protein [Anaerolineales bacterium]
MKYITTIGEREFLVEILDDDQIIVNGKLYHVDFQDISEQPVYSLLLEGKSIEAYVYPVEKTWQVLLNGRFYPALVEDERERSLRVAVGSQVQGRGEYQLKAPMPGLVVTVAVVEGQQVEKGEVLVVLESMKMQNELKSPRSGTVSRVRVASGDRVEQQETLLTVS